MGHVIGFDLEIYDELHESGDWRVDPPRIACIGATEPAGTMTSVRLWYDEGPISQKKLESFAIWLHNKARIENNLIVTANGACFDFPLVWYWLENEHIKGQMREIAMYHHVDMLLAIIKGMGYGVSLDNMARGLNVPGKTADLGKDAPRLWREGGHYEEVLDYLKGDCIASAAVYHALVKAGMLTGWPTRKGHASKQVWTPLMKHDVKKGMLRLLTPYELYYWRMKPDVSFEPWSTERYYKWTSDS